MQNLNLDIEQLRQLASEMLLNWGMKLIGVFAVFFIAWLLAGWAQRSVLRGLERAKFDMTLGRFFANMARYAILMVAVLGCLGVFGIETTSFAALIGAMGLAIGLSFQGTLSNFASGIMLLVFRPFRVGDVVSAGGITGVVQQIELFTTEFTALDNRRIVVPNSAIFGSTIENLTHHTTRRVEVDVGTAYGADLDQTRKVLEETVAKVEGGIEDPAPQILLFALGASSIDWKIRLWCKTEDFWTVRERMIRDCKYALDAAGIGIPFPQRELSLAPEAATALRGKG